LWVLDSGQGSTGIFTEGKTHVALATVVSHCQSARLVGSHRESLVLGVLLSSVNLTVIVVGFAKEHMAVSADVTWAN